MDDLLRQSINDKIVRVFNMRVTELSNLSYAVRNNSYTIFLHILYLLA